MKAAGSVKFAALCSITLTMMASSPSMGNERIERGRILSERLCSRCHAIGLTGESSFDPAPPFRTIADRYEVEMLEGAFAEGIAVGHPAMPVFEFAPNEIGDLIAYLGSLN